MAVPAGQSAAPLGRRAEELSRNVAAVEERIVAACAEAGRSRDGVTVIAVTKTYPPEDVRALAARGVRDVGESRDQEARVKVAQCGELGLRWHFVGQLQRNKVASVASYAWMIHTVDRPELVDALALAAQRNPDVRPQGGLLVQVALDRQAAPHRGGAPASAVPALADRIAGCGLRLAGIMAVAPRQGDARAAFDDLAAVGERLRRDHPQATVISAGMSNDLAPAIAAGATHLRVGSAILGNRPELR